jgi:hypothetical protein
VDARFALIGGLALASHNVIRATQDIDLLTDSEPFAADGGITHVPAVTSRDPFEDDLMTVIEALCPVWPNRDIFSSSDRFLI